MKGADTPEMKLKVEQALLANSIIFKKKIDKGYKEYLGRWAMGNISVLLEGCKRAGVTDAIKEKIFKQAKTVDVNIVGVEFDVRKHRSQPTWVWDTRFHIELAKGKKLRTPITELTHVNIKSIMDKGKSSLCDEFCSYLWYDFYLRLAQNELDKQKGTTPTPTPGAKGQVVKSNECIIEQDLARRGKQKSAFVVVDFKWRVISGHRTEGAAADALNKYKLEGRDVIGVYARKDNSYTQILK